MRIAGSHIVVTGASRGIGRAIAGELAARGARLSLVARNVELLKKTAAELEAAPIAVDLAIPRQLATVIPEAEHENGPVDVVVNNAGLQAASALADIDPSRLHDVIATNLTAPLGLCRQALPTMLPRRSGALVNISSLAGNFALRNILPYNASKAALTSATQILQRELRGTGVVAELVMIGYVPTDMMHESLEDPVAAAQATRLRRLPALTPQSVAQDIADGIEKGKARIVLPPLATPLHWSRQLPTKMVDAIMIGILNSYAHS